MTHKLCQNANSENGGTTIQVSIMHVLFNIVSISSLPRVHDTSVNFDAKKSSHVILRFEKKNAGGRLELLASIYNDFTLSNVMDSSICLKRVSPE